MSEFNDQFFEKRLLNLKETQDSITGLSAWCLQHRDNHKAIVGSWLKVLKKVKIEQRLTLFYLANDVIQYSKRKSLQFVESWGTALQKATTLVRDDKVKQKILRLFKIWNERSIYDEVFLSDLCGLLTTTTKKNANAENNEFQPNVMFDKMKQLEILEDSTNDELGMISENPLNLNDIKHLGALVKERRTSGQDVESELEEGIAHLNKYMVCLKQELTERTTLLELLEQGEAFYESQKKEAKVVSNAYKNFGSRVKTMKRKLDDLVSTLPSPVPSPDINAPSPSPHDDIDLPEDDTTTTTTDYAYNPTSLNSTAQYAQYNNSSTNMTADTSTSSDFYTPTPTSNTHNNSTSYGDSNTQNNSTSAGYGESNTSTVGYEENNTSYGQQEYTPTPFTSTGFASFIGSTTLPFDIQKSLFSSEQEPPPPPPSVNTATTSSDANLPTTESNYEGNKIEVIGSTTSKTPGGDSTVPPPSIVPPPISLPPTPHPDESGPVSLASILNMLKQPPPTPTSSQSYTPTQGQSYSPPTQASQYSGVSPTPVSQYTPSTQYVPTNSVPGYNPTPTTQPPPSYNPTPTNQPPPYNPIPTNQPPPTYNNIPTPTTPGIEPLPLAPPPLPLALFDLDEEFKPPQWLLNAQETPTTPVGGYSAPPPNVYTPPPPPAGLPPKVNPLPAKFPTWDSMLSQSDSPASPPPSMEFDLPPLPPLPSGPAEYDDANSVDVDDRSLPVISRLRKDTDHRHNMPDTDHRASQHRNLISLTGSPKIDADYRGHPSRSNSLDHADSNSNSNGQAVDNTESVDMDLSDDDLTDSAGKGSQFKGSFNINTGSGKREITESKPDSIESMLDIDTSLIVLDATAEKLLSSINMDALAALKTATPMEPQTPAELQTPAEPPAPSTPSPAPQPAATSTPRPPRPPLQRHPHGGIPRFRQRFDGGGYPPRRPYGGPRYSPFPQHRMEPRGGYRPRW
uniref:Regulation of nuclear pre-mRNA domain-containing protein 2 n=1 Tax=Cacopsylla melanoneura TaxID=428564 RepID=A0A8D8YYY0_9HEMI